MTRPYCGHADCDEIGHWEHMPCRDEAPHEPHNWDRPVMLYGPYRCPGVSE